MAVFFKNILVTELNDFPPRLVKDECLFYVTLNAEISLIAEKDVHLQRLFSLNRVRSSIDGQWLLWALRRKYQKSDFRKISGSDAIYTLAKYCSENGRRLFLMGGAMLNNERAVYNLTAMNEGLIVDGFSPDFFDPRVDDELTSHQINLIRESIIKFRPHFIVTGLGAPKEQVWALRERHWLDANGIQCVFFFGGAIDFASGFINRAPLILQRLGLESVYRLVQQPSRLRRFLSVLSILPDLITKNY